MLTAKKSAPPRKAPLPPGLESNVSRKIQVGYGPDRMAETVREVMELMEHRLSEKIAEGRGSLSGWSMNDLLTSMKSLEDPELIGIIQRGWTDMNRAVEARIWDEGRTHPLFRMIVEKFAPLLTGRGHPAQQGTNLSRRVIHPLMFALKQMNGPGYLEEYEVKCRRVVEQLKAEHGDRFSWQLVYDDPEANQLADDVIVQVAHYFQDCSKRRNWMVSVFTHAMDQPHGSHGESVPEGEEDWRFGNWEFHLMVGALFSDLFRSLDDPESLGDLMLRYGAKSVSILRNVKKSLEEDRRQFL